MTFRTAAAEKTKARLRDQAIADLRKRVAAIEEVIAAPGDPYAEAYFNYREGARAATRRLRQEESNGG